MVGFTYQIAEVEAEPQEEPQAEHKVPRLYTDECIESKMIDASGRCVLNGTEIEEASAARVSHSTIMYHDN